VACGSVVVECVCRVVSRIILHALNVKCVYTNDEKTYHNESWCHRTHTHVNIDIEQRHTLSFSKSHTTHCTLHYSPLLLRRDCLSPFPISFSFPVSCCIFNITTSVNTLSLSLDSRTSTLTRTAASSCGCNSTLNCAESMCLDA
jgi:hypothetical protein